MDLIREILVKNLLDLRKSRGLSQTDIASKIGITSQTYNRWEGGLNWPDTASLEKLADYYGIRSSRFFYDPELDKSEIQQTWVNRPSVKDIKKALQDVIDLLDK